MRKVKRHKLFHHSAQSRMVRNIRAVLAQSTSEEVSAGIGWYATANRGCVIWGEQYNVDARTVASVIAALSPQVEWQSNLRHALNMVSGDNGPVPGASHPLQANIRKARAILADNAFLPDSYFKSAPKVCAFARNLQGDTRTVTVDTHAAQIAMANPTYVFRFAPNPFKAVALAYQSAANLEGIEPCEMQAIVWLTWKRLFTPERKRSIIAKEGRR